MLIFVVLVIIFSFFLFLMKVVIICAYKPVMEIIVIKKKMKKYHITVCRAVFLLWFQVEGMEVGLTIDLENQQGNFKLSLLECGCYVKDVNLQLDGGASWLYQGYVPVSQESFKGKSYPLFIWQYIEIE